MRRFVDRQSSDRRPGPARTFTVSVEIGGQELPVGKFPGVDGRTAAAQAARSVLALVRRCSSPPTFIARHGDLFAYRYEATAEWQPKKKKPADQAGSTDRI